MLKIKPSLYLLASFSIWLSGCASPKIDLEDTVFLTKITNTGLKHFEVGLKRARPEKKALTNKDVRRQRRQESRINPSKITSVLIDAANRHIEQNGYCTTDYWILDTNIYSSNITLRGECNEPASSQDRAQYPDTIKRW
ncbi:hypothetical protein [Agarilytica rhodophyticola]|uniref:hypothetical protein n=1 Tax=Agarilytica rhodophyticola TaxID=1737490 RepID=UPI000B3425CF|nr:hypothetical protein [Agarilytica rhodophyticola]